MFAADGFDSLKHCIAAGSDFFVATGVTSQWKGNVNRNNGRFGNHDSPPAMVKRQTAKEKRSSRKREAVASLTCFNPGIELLFLLLGIQTEFNVAARCGFQHLERAIFRLACLDLG